MSTRSTIFFFHEDDPKTGFLSQWYPCAFAHDGITFNSAEQWMMWHKAKLAGDAPTAARILATTSPLEQKQLGKQVRAFDNKAWDEVKVDVVERGNYLKFTQGVTAEGVPLKRLLLETYSKELVEASPFDRVWGIGLGVKEAPLRGREQWGEGLLGKAIMKVRQRLQEEVGGE